MSAPGLYVLAVVRAGSEPAEARVEFDVPVVLRPVRQGELAAVAGDTLREDWTFDRGDVFASHVRAHQDALLRLGASTASVPFPYGTVAEGETALEALLATRAGLFESLLAKLGGCDAFEVGVRFEPEHVLRSVAAGDDGFVEVLRRAAGAGPEAETARRTMQERLDGWLRRESRLLAARCLGALAPVARDLRERPRRAAESALEAVFLVPREGRERFEAALDGLAARLPGGVRLSLVGPLPPVPFADARLAPVDRDEIERARGTLGMPARASRAEIHAAYLREAAAAHPDAGGDVERFRQVDGAWRTLSAYADAAGAGDDARLALVAADVPLVFVLAECTPAQPTGGTAGAAAPRP